MKEVCKEGHCHGAGVAVVVILAAVLVCVAFAAGSLSQQGKGINVSTSPSDNLRTLNVSGSVEKMVSPDKVEVLLGVETLDKSAQVSQSVNADTTQKVMAALKALSISGMDLQTTSYSVNEEYKWDEFGNKSTLIGYRTSNQIKITLTGAVISKAGEVVDSAVGAGANKVLGITFGLTKEKELSTREAALREAGAVAKSKADAVASSLGVSLGKIHTINESGYFYSPNYSNFAADSVGSSAKGPTPITAGDVTVNASVSVDYELQ